MAAVGADAWTGLSVRQVQAFTAVGMMLLGCATVWRETVLSHLAVWSAMAAFAAAGAFAMEEAALEVSRSTPGSRSRWVGRFALLLLPLAAALAGLVLVAASSSTVVWWVAAAELTGLLLVAAGATTTLAGRVPAPAERVAEGVTMAVLVLALANPVARWLEVLPLEASGEWGRTAALWAVLSLGALALLVRQLRDPVR